MPPNEQAQTVKRANINLGVTCQNQHRHPLRVFLRNSVFAVSFKIKQSLVRNDPYFPTACYSDRCPSMSVKRSYLVVAGHSRTLYSGLLQTCSSKARMPAIRCYQSCRRLPSPLIILLATYPTRMPVRIGQAVKSAICSNILLLLGIVYRSSVH